MSLAALTQVVILDLPGCETTRAVTSRAVTSVENCMKQGRPCQHAPAQCLTNALLPFANSCDIELHIQVMWTRLARLGSTDICNCGVVLRSNPNCVQRRYPRVAVRSRTLCSVGVSGQQHDGSSVPTEDRGAQSVVTSWDTIAALSSGAGRCGVALLRVSGPRAGAQLITAQNVNLDCFGRLFCVNCRSSVEKCPATPQGITGTQKSGTQTCSETYLLPQSASKHSECGLQVVSELHHPSSHEVLDKALLLRFPGPHSFTGR